MTEAPRNLDQLKAIADPAERARAAKAYVQRAEKAISDALAVRNEAILLVLGSNGVTATANLCGVSVSTVKLVRKDSQATSG
jgi:hypothetical protein